MNQYSYINGEERPVEVLVFRMDPAVVVAGSLFFLIVDR